VLAGDPVTVADAVIANATRLASALSVSAAGLLAYRPGGANRRQLRWVDRTGKSLGALGTPEETGLSNPSLSPDGGRVAVRHTVQGNADIYWLDGTRTSRFTFDAGADFFPRWSRDGSQIVFTSNRKGAWNLYVQPANGAGSEALLLESPQNKVATDWSPDGRFLVYQSQSLKTDWHLWVLPLDGGPPRRRSFQAVVQYTIC
jgi:dipeptidyl aminopeptidase/acylaminoacyl peptidase